MPLDIAEGVDHGKQSCDPQGFHEEQAHGDLHQDDHQRGDVGRPEAADAGGAAHHLRHGAGNEVEVDGGAAHGDEHDGERDEELVERGGGQLLHGPVGALDCLLVLIHVPVDDLGALKQAFDVLVDVVELLLQPAPVGAHLLQQLVALLGGLAVLRGRLLVGLDQGFVDVLEDIADHGVGLGRDARNGVHGLGPAGRRGGHLTAPLVVLLDGDDLLAHAPVQLGIIGELLVHRAIHPVELALYHALGVLAPLRQQDLPIALVQPLLGAQHGMG